jgi:hypothetical protein
MCAISFIYHVLRGNENYMPMRDNNNILINLDKVLLFSYIKFLHDLLIIAICLNKYIDNIFLLYIISSIISLIEQKYKIPFHVILPSLHTIMFIYQDNSRAQYLLPGSLVMIRSKLYNHELPLIEKFIWHYSSGHAIYYCFI